MLFVFFGQISLFAWEFWAIEESTPVMFGINLVVRGLLLTWSWAILFRLYRVIDED